MAETRDFSTAAVISAMTGILVCPMGDMHELLQWMADEPVWTHQLPRVSREAATIILANHPQLAPVATEAEGVTPDNWMVWRDTWCRRYGETIAVPKLTASTHERIDPLSELAESVHPDRIVQLKV